ncbi:DNA-directed RNA polymerase subunit omega [Sporobacter termitidis DSM 10068]|uniref:DNA-directed RNA polymerase subunit omega n=1 Tax=Sporobacter termitidis DSM 10068 TaxID=1123282 RepID=A0A1M5THR2_9FIRM|nr:DNA-directed RNA polymerase subunit omega [Sporobacter termitidis]SHH50287.1 DNA-directed RNA polymerase subunit omega [Sporobacter termitidis DSM 10068]
MLYPSLTDLLKQVNSRYMLVNIIAQRAREIAVKSEESGEPLDKKPVSSAIEEIASGSIQIHHDSDLC